MEFIVALILFVGISGSVATAVGVYLNARERGLARKTITLKDLHDMKACSSAYEEFRATFGYQASVEEVFREIRRQGYTEYEAWLLEQTKALTEAMLAAGADVNVCEGEPLWFASGEGNMEVVELLLAAGADVHANNDAALCRASEGGNTEIVKLLIEAGADVHADDNAALRYASCRDHVQS